MKLSGVSAELAVQVKAAGGVVPRSSQPGLPLVDGTALDLALQLMPNDKPAAVKEARRAGRPKGSRNRRSEELCGFILRQHGHPMQALAQLWSRSTDAVAAELGCDKLAAMSLQVKAAAEALPYFESKKPVAIQSDGRIIQLVIEGGHAGIAAPGDAATALKMIDGGTFDGTDGGGADE